MVQPKFTPPHKKDARYRQLLKKEPKSPDTVWYPDKNGNPFPMPKPTKKQAKEWNAKQKLNKKNGVRPIY